jgi:ASC-1-like (ASCH) protein
MLLVRDVMYCKPGKVRPMVEKFVKMSKLSEKMGMPKMKVMTDLTAERYWMLVSEMEVASLKEFEEMFANMGQDPNDPNAKEFENIMKDYHDLVESGRREIFKIEG